MTQNNDHPSAKCQSEQRRRVMVSETEEYLNRRVNDSRVAQHRGDRIDDTHGDPRRTVAFVREPNRPAKADLATVHVNTLIRVPTDEHGHLSETLLDQWGVYLSRLIAMPHRGNVLLDLAEVVTVPNRFVQVYEWFRRHLATQGRFVLVQISGACIEDPDPTQLPELLRVVGTHRVP